MVWSVSYSIGTSMWRVAKTLDDSSSRLQEEKTENSNNIINKDTLLFGRKPVPTNAFQPYLIDGKTKPTFHQRVGSFIAPMKPLFQAGIVSSAVGYGIGAILVTIRSWVLPSYVPVTQPINIGFACVYTGCFMAIVSNIRYQILQGVIEPFIEQNNVIQERPKVRSFFILMIRWLNGLLGSILAISGMRLFGLQKLK